MANAPIITFPDVKAVVSAHLTRTHGVTPNAIVLNIAPQLETIGRKGDLRIQYENIDVTLPDCLVDADSYQFDSQRRIVTLVIFDRRWNWQYKVIDGHYNRRNETGDIIFAGPDSPQVPALDTIRSAFQLAVRLLEALGEENYDVADVPHDVYPEVEWVAANAASELEQLCHILRLRVILKWDNTIAITKLAVGESLPDDLPVIRHSSAVDVKTRPSKIGIACSPTLFQMDLFLEPVGEDRNGDISPLGDLLIQPFEGWPPHFSPHTGFKFEDEDTTRLANATVYKWYRIKLPFTFPTTVNLMGFKIEAMEQIVPILSHQSLVTSEDGRLVNVRPIVYGVWYKGGDKVDEITGNTVPTFADLKPLPENPNPEAVTVVPGGYSINGEKGIVEFSRPIWQVEPSTDVLLPADLVLRTSFHIRNDSGAWSYQIFDRPLEPPTISDDTYIVRRPELFVSERVVYPDPPDFANMTVMVNTNEVRAITDLYTDAIRRDFEPTTPRMDEIAGLHKIELTGSIRTVEWSIDSSGVPITTTVHRDSDEGGFGNLGYEQLRVQRRLRTLSGYLPKLSADDRRRLERERRK